MTAPAPLSTHAILEHAARGGGDGTRGEREARVVTLDRHFQGLPDTAHGGTVLALFDAVAPTTGARVLRGVYRRRVPLSTPLSLTVDRADGAARFALSDGATLLAEGTLDRAVDGPRAGAPPARLAVPAAHPLPISRTCFACGIENPLGLKVQLAIDGETVGGRWTPTTALRAPDGSIAPVAITTLLDEAAFWLGAAASGEAGMTTGLRVELHGPLPTDGGITVAGTRAAVRPHPDDARYWHTDIAAWNDTGALVATARITFVAVRGAAKKLVTGLLAMNPPDVLANVFPSYVR